MLSYPIKNSFNAGEVSPLFGGRTDVDKYANACDLTRNYIPLVQGALTSRPGTRFVAEVFDSTKKTWLRKFEFNFEQSYVLEFSPGKLRFYINRGILESSPGVPYVLDTPFTESMLTNADGTFGLSMVQSNDIIYIACRNLPPQKLIRTTVSTWTIASVDFLPEPFAETNNPVKNATTLNWNGSAGLTASANYFTAEMAGRQIYIGQKVDQSINQWQGNVSISSGAYAFNGVNLYLAATTATTGIISPIHTLKNSTQQDGSPGVRWVYKNSGFIYLKITSVTNATNAVVSVPNQNNLGDNLTGDTGIYASSAWSAGNFPTHVTFFRERLVFARDQYVWFSKVGDYENFAYNEFGQVTDESAFDVFVQSDKSGEITFLSPVSRGLIIGTSDGEILITESTTSETFGPRNRKIVQATGYGSRAIQPIRVEDNSLFIQRGGKKIRESVYSFETDGVKATDISVLSDHLLIGNSNGITDMAMAREPFSVVWMVRDDGVLVGMTYNNEQKVTGFSEHTIGDATKSEPNAGVTVESVTSIPSPDGKFDDLWLIVNLLVDGVERRYVCYMEEPYKNGALQNTAFYVDLGLTYEGIATTIITGLDYLEGRQVSILADGATHPTKIVTGGQITLDRSSTVVHVGLGYIPLARLNRFEIQNPSNTMQGKLTRMNLAILRVYNTAGVKIGVPTLSQLYQINNDDPSKQPVYEYIKFRKPQNLMNNPPPLFTGDTEEITLRDGYTRECKLTIIQPDPLPSTIIAVMPQLEAN